MSAPANGDQTAAEASEQALYDALQGQDAPPPVYEKPAPPSASWLEARIALQERIVDAAKAQVALMDSYQRMLREEGALNVLKHMQAELLNQQQPD